jgi:hypothetical protein
MVSWRCDHTCAARVPTRNDASAAVHAHHGRTARATRSVSFFEAHSSEGYSDMKDLLWTNFQLTRSTGVPTMVVIDGVSVEIRKQGAAPAPVRPKKKVKAKKPRRPAKKASGAKPKPKRAPEAASKGAAVRRTETVPQ